MRRDSVLVIMCMFLIGILLIPSFNIMISGDDERPLWHPQGEGELSKEIPVENREDRTDRDKFGGSWFQSRDTDFLECTLDDVSVVGRGLDARVDLSRKKSAEWRNMDPGTSPSGRYGHAMTFSSIEGKVVLFGGYDGGYDDETWCYDARSNTWTQMEPSRSPSARYYHKMTYDSKNNKVVMFGGYSSKSDTWCYDVENDLWTNPLPDPHPPTLYQHAMAYDSINNKVVLFGGRHHSGGWKVMNETWVYDTALNQWTKRDPPVSPPARRAHGLTYFPAYNKVVLFGGYDGSSYINDTWIYDVSSNRWTEIHPYNSPPVKGYPAMVYDSEIHKIVVYGGLNYEPNVRQFDLDANTWTTKTYVPQPTNRYSHAMAYDPVNSKAVLFGGYPSYKDDTWTYDPIRYSTSGKLTSPVITLSGGYLWDRISLDKFETPGTYINITILDALTSLAIPGFSGISGYHFDISPLNAKGITAVRLVASFTGSMDITPTLYSWGIQWKMDEGLYDDLIGDNNLAAPYYADNDTVALWHFNEGAGQTANDISGSGNDGILGGGVNVEPSDPAWIESKFDSGLRFDGKDDYIWVENSGSLKPDDILSIEAWFKMDGSRKRTMALLGTRADSDYSIQILANGTVRALVSTIDRNQDEYNELHSSTMIRKGLWYHVALTFHRPDLILYINGIEEARITADFPMRHSNVPLFVGAEVGSPHFPYQPINHFYGIMDSIRISNISRGSRDILLNARGGLSLTNGSGRIAPNTPLPGPDTVILYSFEDDDLKSIRDGGPNSVPGQFHGTKKVTSGKFGSALEFNGFGDLMEVGDSALVHLSCVTYQFWMKCHDTAEKRILLYEEKEGSNGINEMAALDASGRVHYTIDNGTHDIVSEQPLPMDEWVHLALVRSDTEVKIYINGEESARGGISGFDPEDTKPLLIGGNGSNIDGFQGLLDEVIVLNGALSSDTIRSQANIHERIAAFRTKGISLPGWSAETPSRIWNTFQMDCEVPESTHLNATILDNATGEIMVEIAANSGSMSADLKGINVLEHPSLRIRFMLDSDGEDSPTIFRYRINWSEVGTPVRTERISEEIFLTEDTPQNGIMNLSEYFYDEYSTIANSTYSIEDISDPGNVNLSLNGSILDAKALSENWTGTVKP